MAAIKSPGAFTKLTMYITRFVSSFVLPHYQNVFLYIAFIKSNRLSPETFYQLLVILTQHGRHRIPLGTKFEQRKLIVLFSYTVFLHACIVCIYSRKFVFGRICT